MNRLGGSVPASVVCITRVCASVHSWLLHLLNALILQAFLDFKQLLSRRFFIEMACSADSWVPFGTFRAQEVAIDFFLYLRNNCFGFLVIRVVVVLPPVEACLVLAVVELAVMDRADPLSCLEVVLLGQWL